MTRTSTLALALALVGCSDGVNLEQSAAEGRTVSAVFRVSDQGDLDAVQVNVEEIDADDDDNDNDNDNDNDFDGEHEDNDDDDDVELEQEGEHEDADGDGDGDDEDTRYVRAAQPAFLQGIPARDHGGLYSVLGIEINAGANPVPIGNTLFVGDYDGAGYLAARAAEVGAGTQAVGGTSEGLRRVSAGHYELEIMGLTLQIGPETERMAVVDPLDPQSLVGNAEDDDIDCEQEGENEGNNEGC